jgi:L-arabinose isomerase
MSVENKVRIGLCGIGLDTYWPQFSGLKERLAGFVSRVGAHLEQPGVHVVNLGLVDSPRQAQETGRACRRQEIDALFLYVTTYALSNTVLPLVQRAGVPVIVLNLQPEAAIDYSTFNRLGDRTAMTGVWLAYCSACPVPEIANVFSRARIPFHQSQACSIGRRPGAKLSSGLPQYACAQNWLRPDWDSWATTTAACSTS